MLKFFRKYNKLILAVTAAFLMVAFLAPQALQRFGANPRARVVARLAGQEITEGRLSRAASEIEALDQIDSALRQTAGLSFMSQLLGVSRSNMREHWLLLTTAAERGGFYGGPQDGRNFLLTAAEWAMGQINQARLRQGQEPPTPDQITQETNALIDLLDRRRVQIVGNRGMTVDDVNLALAKAHGVLRMRNMYVRASQLSDLEAVAEARFRLDEVVVDYTIIPTTSVISEAPTPTDEQLEELFEAHKDEFPSEGEHGFGYKRRRAVRVEFIALNRAELEPEIDPDPVEIYTHWERNKGEYGADFDLANEQVEEDLRTRLVERAIAAASQAIKAEILRAHQGIPREDGRLVLPDGWSARRADFEAIVAKVADQLRRDFGVEEPPIRAVRQESIWWDRTALETFHPMANAGIRVANNLVRFPDIVLSVLENDPAAPFRVQEDVAFTEPLRARRSGQRAAAAPQGDLFYFRVIDAREAAPPASFEEIRGDVAEDWRELWAYERLVERASEIEALAARDLEAVVDEWNGSAIRSGIRVRRTGAVDEAEEPVEGRFNNQIVRDAVLDRAAPLDPTVPIDAISPDARTFAIPVPDTLQFVVVRVQALKPAALEIFRRDEPLIARANMLRRNDTAFTFDELAERMDYVSLVQDEDEEDGLGAEQEDEPTREAAPESA